MYSRPNCSEAIGQKKDILKGGGEMTVARNTVSETSDVNNFFSHG